MKFASQAAFFVLLTLACTHLSAQDSLATRCPPGQRIVENFPLLHYAEIPDIHHDNWTLKITGGVKKKLKMNWEAFSDLESVESISDFHCVTGWSRLDLAWRGVRIRDLLEMAGLKKSSRFITFYSYDGYITSLPIDACLGDDDILATHLDGELIKTDMGGPVRVVIPGKYGYKSALWIREIRLTRRQKKGYYEKQGYSNNADPWKEERFDFDQ